MILDKAIVFAVNTHSGAKRKGTTIPYILHPMETASIVATMTDDVNIIAAAVLHDVLEDTSATYDEIEREFGTVIAQLVSGETEDKRGDQSAQDTWKIRKQETIDRLRNESDTAKKMIALGDKLSNIRAICRDYKATGEKFWERFNQKDKNEHAWYYRSICQALSEMKEYAAWQEYDRLVNEVFK